MMHRVTICAPYGKVTWYRGDGHTAADAAEFARRKFWRTQPIGNIEVVDPLGNRVFPMFQPAGQAEAARLFERALSLHVTLTAGGGG